MQHEIGEHEDSWEYVPGEEVINLQFYYPIIITHGEIYECHIRGKKPSFKRVHRINFIRRYHSNKLKGEYRIDVVTETGFRRLLPVIEKEVEEIASRIRKKMKILRDSANRIAEDRAKSEQKNRPEGRKGE